MKLQATERKTATVSAGGVNAFPQQNLLRGNRDMPDFTTAAMTGGMADAANSMSKLAMTIHDRQQQLETQTQNDLDDNAVMRVQGLMNARMSAFTPDIDEEKAKLAIDDIRETMTQELETLPGVSDRAKTRLTELISLGNEKLNVHQKFGRMKLIQQEKQESCYKGLNQAVESGSPELVDEYVKMAEDNRYKLRHSPDKYRSQAIMHRDIVNTVQNLDTPHLQAVKDNLEEVNEKGDSSIWKGMQREEVYLARRHIQNLIAERHNSAIDKLRDEYRKGTLTQDSLQRDYVAGNLPLPVFQSWNNMFLGTQKQTREANADKMSLDLYSAEWKHDPVERKQQYAEWKTKIFAAPFDFGHKEKLLKKLDASRDSFEKPGKSNESSFMRGKYMAAQWNENIKEKLNVYKESWFRDKIDPDRSEKLEEVEWRHAEKWLEADDRSQEDIDNYIKTVQEKYTEKIYIEKFNQILNPDLKKASELTSRALRPAAKTLEPGTVRAGYRFIGGDPANPSAWEKL